jgi:hypothetical protein
MSVWIEVRDEVAKLEQEIKLMRALLSQKEAHLEGLSKILEEFRTKPKPSRVAGEERDPKPACEPGPWQSLPRDTTVILGPLADKIMLFLSQNRDISWCAKDLEAAIGEESKGQDGVSTTMSRLFQAGLTMRREAPRQSDGKIVLHHQIKDLDGAQDPAPVGRGARVESTF